MKNNTDLSKIAIELENLDLSNVKLGFSEFLSNNDIQAKINPSSRVRTRKNIVGSVGRQYPCVGT